LDELQYFTHFLIGDSSSSSSSSSSATPAAVGQLYTYQRTEKEKNYFTAALPSSSASSKQQPREDKTRDDSTTLLARQQAWDLAYESTQLAEYVLRGHARWIPGSLYYLQTNHQQQNTDDSSSSSSLSSPLSPLEHVHMMQSIVTRMEQEGEMYLQLRQERLSRIQLEQDRSHHHSSKQHATTGSGGGASATATAAALGVENDRTGGESSSSSDSSSDSDSDSDNEESDSDSSSDEDDDKASKYPFAPPGATVTMYNILLDSMAAAIVASSSSSPVSTIDYTPTDLTNILLKLLHHNDLDGGITHNINPNTMPTIQSFNAVLRGISNFSSSSLNSTQDSTTTTMKLRDDCLMQAFGIYNGLASELEPMTKQQQGLCRNAATIRYMMDILRHTFPVSRTRGNMSVSLFVQAQQLGVVDATVLQAMYDLHYENADAVAADATAANTKESHESESDSDVIENEFRQYFLPGRVVVENDNSTILSVRKLPYNWTKNAKFRRQERSSAMY
jgi:hypothetical protein